jgi:hypothetical protein
MNAMPERRKVQYSSAADIISDVERLRKSTCQRCGQWSLAQACWHLNMQFSSMVQSGDVTPNTPEQTAAHHRISGVIQGGVIPSGRPAPERAMPPAEPPEDAIDNFVATLQKFDSAKGPFKTHPVFGNLSEDEAKRFSYVHAAHHLSHYVPNNSNS